MAGARDGREFDRRLEEMGVRIKDADSRKVRGEVFDEVTLLALYRLVHKKKLSAIGGSISTGKEANVFIAERDGQPAAVKIYRIRTANFKAMAEYILGDPRFASVRRTRKDIVFTWTKKEFSNLKRAHDAGVPVPEPYAFDRNILIMEFIGEGEAPAPQLRTADIPDPQATYREIIDHIARLYQEARLVHGDLSEFNILWQDKPYIIDMGQAVTRDHPNAGTFLIRDIRNINRFFSNLCDIEDEDGIMRSVTGGTVRKLSDREE
ncbi:serine protein kinase RIO [Methanofollis fontis]|uniref:non-specific serine/threonine protein kinase n=1 Tax=Methanofollis fontis TaxID=2052832 RepID=A0A483CQV6_9EURY|nr:serine protein kinase RIO [Methanofollis fontis]TAJ45505.1 serine/threonine protein kinase [Methanofollis fontis]